MQRKHFHLLGIAIGISLIVLSFTVKSFSHNSSAINLSTPAAPVLNLYPSSLTDQAKLNNVFQSPIVTMATQLPDFAVVPVDTKQRCSAQFAYINHEALGLPEPVLNIALKAYHHARLLGLDAKHLLTVVDYQKPSNEKRLFVFDLNSNKLLFDTYVAHGARTGKLYAKHFSNRVNSYESSLGVILTGKTYEGIEGYSMRLHGLEKAFNSNVFKRNVVMHPADYVSKRFVISHHQAGKSFGCLAVSRKIAKNLINTIKNGTIIVNYFPNSRWLYHSRFLQ